jgi:hypothetical protein
MKTNKRNELKQIILSNPYEKWIEERNQENIKKILKKTFKKHLTNA